MIFTACHAMPRCVEYLAAAVPATLVKHRGMSAAHYATVPYDMC
jgi:hypothetical protein